MKCLWRLPSGRWTALRVIIIDDEQPGIDELSYQLSKYPDVVIAGTYTNPLIALERLEGLRPDAVFLDIDMPYINGVQLALKIQSLYAGIMIIFVTAYSQYALDSFKAFPLDYLLKPVKEARLDATIEYMRRQYALLNAGQNSNSSLFIKCFGKFELTAPGRKDEIKWGTRRVKELFLYLLVRGGAAPTRGELISSVFGGTDDKKTANNMYVTIYKLRSLLDSIDSSRKLIKLKEDYSLEIGPGICDYTDFMRFARQNATITPKNAAPAAKALNLCAGVYLEGSDYEWALDTASVVEAEYERIALGLAGMHLSAHQLREAENVLQTLLSRNPLSEDGHTTLLDLYMNSGDDAAYGSAFTEYSRILKNDLGLTPSPIYTRHYQKILNK